MTDPALLRSLGYMLVAAAVLLLLTLRLRVPSILAYILAGLLLGPVTGLIAVGEELDIIAEVGIVLLLFLVGLELSFERIRHVGGVALVAGTVQMAVTAGAGYGLALLLGFDAIESLFIALALTFSSTVVVVKLLEQKGDIHALYGRIAVGVLLVQDLAVILVLTVLAGLTAGAELTLASAGRSLLLAFGGMGLLVATAIFSSRRVLPRIFGWIATASEGLLVWSLSWCFLFVLTAELLHLSPEIGAFLAGVSLAQLPYNYNLRRRVHPLMNFFLAVFFVSMGVRMQLNAAVELLPAALALSLAVLVGKPILFMWLLARAGHGRRTGFLTGVSLAQISEFSFIATAGGVSAGLIGEATLSLVGIVGLLTMGVSAYLLLYNRSLYERAERTRLPALFGAPPEAVGEEAQELQDHMIVVGMNALGRRLVEELVRRGESAVAIDTDPRKLVDLPCATILGSAEYYSVLEEASLANAKLLISALQIEDTNNLLAYWCRELGVPASIHAFDRSVVDELREIGVSHLMISKNTGIRSIAAELRKAGILD